MPVIEVHLLEGYTPGSKQRLGEESTDACRMVGGKFTRQDVWNDLAEVRFGKSGAR